jgi:hypothetical protein
MKKCVCAHIYQHFFVRNVCENLIFFMDLDGVGDISLAVAVMSQDLGRTSNNSWK